MTGVVANWGVWCSAALLLLATGVGCDDDPQRDVGPDSTTADMAVVDGRSTDVRQDGSLLDSDHRDGPAASHEEGDARGSGSIVCRALTGSFALWYGPWFAELRLDAFHAGAQMDHLSRWTRWA